MSAPLTTQSIDILAIAKQLRQDRLKLVRFYESIVNADPKLYRQVFLPFVSMRFIGDFASKMTGEELAQADRSTFIMRYHSRFIADNRYLSHANLREVVIRKWPEIAESLDGRANDPWPFAHNYVSVGLGKIVDLIRNNVNIDKPLYDTLIARGVMVDGNLYMKHDLPKFIELPHEPVAAHRMTYLTDVTYLPDATLAALSAPEYYIRHSVTDPMNMHTNDSLREYVTTSHIYGYAANRHVSVAKKLKTLDALMKLEPDTVPAIQQVMKTPIRRYMVKYAPKHLSTPLMRAQAEIVDSYLRAVTERTYDAYHVTAIRYQDHLEILRIIALYRVKFDYQYLIVGAPLRWWKEQSADLCTHNKYVIAIEQNDRTIFDQLKKLYLTTINKTTVMMQMINLLRAYNAVYRNQIDRLVRVVAHNWFYRGVMGPNNSHYRKMMARFEALARGEEIDDDW